MDNCREILQQGLQTLEIAYSEDQLEALLAFLSLMIKWNKAYNLTAIRDPEEMARLHLLDSLAIMPYLKGDRIADIGTGAGLPGIPLAIFFPDKQFTLLDSNAKKTRFVQQAALELKLNNVNVEHSRVERFKPHTLFSSVIMRAFAQLDKIISLTRHLYADDALLLAMKGQNYQQEIDLMSESCTMIPLTVPGVDAERVLISIEMKANG